MKWIFLSLAIVAEVVATTALRSSEGFTKIVPSLITAVGYILAFYFLSLTLKHLSVGVAYAIWSGLGTVLISVVAFFFFKQRLDLPAVIGLLLIVSGVIVLNVFSKSVMH